MTITDKYEKKFKDIDEEMGISSHDRLHNEKYITYLYLMVICLEEKLEKMVYNGINMHGGPPQQQPHPNEHYGKRRQNRAPRGSGHF